MRLINLLPKSRQQELHYQQIFGKFLVVIWLSFGSFLLVFSVQLMTKIYLQSQNSQVQSEISLLKGQVSKSENEQIKKKITSLNNYIADFKNLSSVPKWSKALQAFAALPPDGVGIASLTVDLKSKAVTITGFAPTREKVRDFYNNINNDTKEFHGVDFPLENVAKPTDNLFHFTFYINDDLIK